jgi:VanZ family protein
MSWSRRYLPALLLAAAILAMAGAAGSRDVTGRLANPFLSGLGLSPEVVEMLHAFARKTGHFVAYALFAILALRAVRGPRPVVAGTLGVAGAVAVLLAVADEALQRTSPFRTGSSLDVAIDVAGALTGLALAAVLAARNASQPEATAGGGGPG